MPTLFTRIIDGEIPGMFVWRDDECVSFLSINPVNPGHALVVPRAEVDVWLDLEPPLAAHLMTVAQTIGKAVQAAFSPLRVGLLIAGLEVPHTHLHVMPIHAGESDLHLDRAENASPEELETNAEKIRAALRSTHRDGQATGVSS
ncbi:MAG: HIT family protein [Acidimicrobiia bacterium]|nr:HIT family protein [Acidimicrobiia bacterium]